MMFGDLGNDWLVGGTGKDQMFGGWGDDLLNADDDQSTDPLNNGPDPHPSYEDRAFGGAGRDILIGNTGGDRLIDWIGEFNSFIVPFAPFGEFAISRAVLPQLYQFLYDLSKSLGADPSRAADTGNAAARNGEPDGELGLIIQQDGSIWQDQTGAPADPQPGNIPGGPRDVLRSADFNGSGSLATAGFAPDSGSFTISGGALQVSAVSTSGDAVSVFYVNQQLPGYFEIAAQVKTAKPTAGWNANAYVVFDYQTEYDFKFAGINISTNKIEMGHRTTQGWVVDVQSNVQVKPDTYYKMLVAINGNTVTVVVDNKTYFSYAYTPRVIDGYSYGLNWGLVGLGSNSAKGSFDNIAVQVLPPQITLTYTETFDDGAANLFDPETGSWQVQVSGDNGRYVGAPAAGMANALSLLDLGLEDGLRTSSYLELAARVRTQTVGGLVFDQYGPEDFKFAAIDAQTGNVVIGHNTARRGWVIDVSVAKGIVAGTDYELKVGLKGTTVSVSLNGQVVLGYVFNGVTVDGDFGLLSRGGGSSFDSMSLKTDDPAFAVTSSSNMITETVKMEPEAPTVTQAELDAIATAAMAQWIQTLGEGDTRLATFGNVHFSLADLPDGELGDTTGRTFVVDVNAAGNGWFVDVSPSASEEFRVRIDRNVLAASQDSAAYGRIDLVSVVTHEIGHLLGFDHGDAGKYAVMNKDLEPGIRYVLDQPDFDHNRHAANNDAALLKLAAQAAEFEAAQARLAAARKAEPKIDSLTNRDSSGIIPLIDWQSRTEPNWAMRLSPFDAVKPGKGLSPNFADFAFKFEGEDEDAEDEAQGYDNLGSALTGSNSDDGEGAVEKREDTVVRGHVFDPAF